MDKDSFIYKTDRLPQVSEGQWATLKSLKASRSSGGSSGAATGSSRAGSSGAGSSGAGTSHQHQPLRNNPGRKRKVATLPAVPDFQELGAFVEQSDKETTLIKLQYGHLNVDWDAVASGDWYPIVAHASHAKHRIQSGCVPLTPIVHTHSLPLACCSHPTLCTLLVLQVHPLTAQHCWGVRCDGQRSHQCCPTTRVRVEEFAPSQGGQKRAEVASGCARRFQGHGRLLLLVGTPGESAD